MAPADPGERTGTAGARPDPPPRERGVRVFSRSMTTHSTEMICQKYVSYHQYGTSGVIVAARECWTSRAVDANQDSSG